MKSVHKWMLTALAGTLLMLSGSARADTIVTSDAGNFSTFTLTNLGGGNFELVLTPPSNVTLINGTSVSIPAAFDSVLNFSASVSGNVLTITSGTFTKTFGTGDAIASLSYDLTAGTIGSGLNQNGLILSGLISAVSPNLLPDYDFSGLVGGTNTFALTGAQYSGGARTIADVFAITGASVIGSGGFSENGPQIATPEPSSMALLGIGLSGLVSLRRFFKRTRLA